MKKFQVVGIGNAIVDVLTKAEVKTANVAIAMCAKCMLVAFNSFEWRTWGTSLDSAQAYVLVAAEISSHR